MAERHRKSEQERERERERERKRRAGAEVETWISMYTACPAISLCCVKSIVATIVLHCLDAPTVTVTMPYPSCSRSVCFTMQLAGAAVARIVATYRETDT